ncbi:MAG: nitrogen regulation protein NR(II) [Candidatus Binatia bacterium]
MKRFILPGYFFASVLLLFFLVSFYAFSEANRLQRELLLQTQARGAALAEAMETNVKNAILGNSILEDLITQRLLDNARLIDQLLLSGQVDGKLLREISTMNHLQKIDLLDQRGRRWQPTHPSTIQRRMEEMMTRMRSFEAEKSAQDEETMMIFMWGRHWQLPGEENPSPVKLPPTVAERKFWEGSIFGVAIRARSFPGIIAVHANAEYILNFRKEIAVQRQIQELGRQSDIEHVALLDKDLKVIAHTDPGRVSQQEENSFILKVKADREPLGRIVKTAGGTRTYDVVKPITLNNSTLGFLEIGLSLGPMERAWHKSLRSMIVLALTILAVGVLGMAAIFYTQHSHLERIKSLEAEVARQEHLSALGNLSATVAHEIRNPLNAISMGLQRLKAEFQPTQDVDQYSRFVELMQGEVHRLNSIVEEFLSLARPLELKRRELKIAEMLTELVAFVGSDAQRSRVKLDVLTEPDIPVIRADRNYLKQVLLNLVLNGVQAMPDGGTLTLKASASRRHLLLTVADTGVGISPEILPRIFEPYFTTKAKGSGLGLAIARRIVEAHGGTLTVDSKASQGSRFQLSIPLEGTES